uniref:RING-type domain-containing protein n=1 Tax=Oryza brachyantha TaxID=4533 RepID=J3L170_ORYBR
MYQPEKTSYCAAAADQPDLVDKRPQVDVNAAANGHSRTVDNTSQLDTNNDGGLGHPAVVDVSSDSSHASSPDVEAAAERCHIAVDIDGLDEGGAGCVVCMEPLEWVAVGPCGHRVACSRCAARIRTGPGADKRCCICRRLCPTVVVARAAAGNGVFDFSKMPAATQDGQVGEYWYYASMSAYFDDKKHYEVTKQGMKILRGYDPHTRGEVGHAASHESRQLAGRGAVMVASLCRLVGGRAERRVASDDDSRVD